MINKVILFIIVVSFTHTGIIGQTQVRGNKSAVPIIFDTDIGPDYDDVGAIAILHALEDSNECKILATIASNRHKRIAAVLDVFNSYFKKPDIPIGVVKGKAVDLEAFQKWDSVLVHKFPHGLQSNEEAEDAVSLYRKILSTQPDGSVTIVTVGFLTNMGNLLNSPPDQHSALNGKALVKKKVRQLVCMAGRFDHEMGKFKEFNVEKDAASSKVVFDGWNTPIIFTGFEIGAKIFTGLPLLEMPVAESPVKEVYQISIPKDPQDKNGRMSWDQTAVLIAVRGYEKYYHGVAGRIISKEDGSNEWNYKGKGHIYIKEKMPVEQVQLLINNLMLHQPSKK
jgi:inosine-uridine nucleoside N-ribohydrolase